MSRNGLLASGLLLLAGCGGGGDPINRLADEPDQLTVYSLDGLKIGEADGLPNGTEIFHNVPVLGRVEVTDPAVRREIVGAVKASAHGPKQALACYWPRHAVRTVQGGATVDVLICFQCRNYHTYLNGQGAGGGVGVTPDAKPLLDKVLTDAGVKLAPESPEKKE